MPKDGPAIVVINSLRHVDAPDTRRWLERGSLTVSGAPRNLPERLLASAGAALPAAGFAALRYFGQTGVAADGWLAAADPVYLEPRLDHLCLHSLKSRVSADELAALFDHLNASLGDAQRFDAADGLGYLFSSEIPVSGIDPDELHGYVPNDFLPAHGDAGAFRGLLSEIEMALHEHPVNQARQARGEQPVNSLWLWGGGEYAAPSGVRLPALYADDPLLRGLWAAAGQASADWSSGRGIEAGSVTVFPESSHPDPQSQLGDVHAAFVASGLPAVDILSREGDRAQIRRSDRWRFWRRAKLPETAA